MTTTVTVPSVDKALGQIERTLGFVPNLFREMGASPATLQAYLATQDALGRGSLTEAERQAVQLAVSAFNACLYCQAAHQSLGRRSGISQDDLDAVRAGGLPAAEGPASVVRATRLVLEKKGWLAASDLNALERQGVTRTKLYEIVVLIGLKTVSNYIHHMSNVPIDQEFAG